MSDPETRVRTTVTALLSRWSAGDRDAGGEAFSQIYDELRRIAASYLRIERPGHTLQPTAIVHEAFLRLNDQHQVDWHGRAHFLGIAARVMRQVLVDHGRRRGRAKRGGDRQRAELVDFGDPRGEAPVSMAEVLALDDALGRLAAWDEQKARIVEARFFAGMTVPEIAIYAGVSTATVNRELRRAKAWLYRDMAGQAP